MFFGDGKDDHLTIMLDEKLYITELSMPKVLSSRRTGATQGNWR